MWRTAAADGQKRNAWKIFPYIGKKIHILSVRTEIDLADERKYIKKNRDVDIEM